MKVSNSVNSSLGKVDSAKTQKTESSQTANKNSAAVASSESAKGPAKLSLSDRAQQMQKAKEIASDQSIDESKVARLQKMIDEGAYKTDAAAIADRMVDEHLLMND